MKSPCSSFRKKSSAIRQLRKPPGRESVSVFRRSAFQNRFQSGGPEYVSQNLSLPAGWSGHRGVDVNSAGKPAQGTAMGRKQDYSETGSGLPRSFSYRGTPVKDIARSIAIIAGSVYLPLYVALRFWAWDEFEKSGTPWWAYLLAGIVAFGGVAGIVEGWRRLRRVRNCRERGEKLTATSNGLSFEDCTTFVELRWDEITGIGHLGNTCLIQTPRGVIAFTQDLWGWQHLSEIIAVMAQSATTMTPEEAAAAASNIAYPSLPVH